MRMTGKNKLSAVSGMQCVREAFFKNYYFTILELMIVVAIITILAAMLLPSLKIAKNTATALQCLSNYRQLGVAAAHYYNDYNCAIGYSFQDVSGTTYAYWYKMPLLYMKYTGNIYGAYNKNGGTFACPSVTESDVAAGNKWGNIWGANTGTIGVQRQAFTTNAELMNFAARVKYPSRLCYFADSFAISVAKRTVSSPPLGAEIRTFFHKGGAAVVYFDGHVNFRNKGSFNETKSTPFWDGVTNSAD